MRISDWSSDVCSSDLAASPQRVLPVEWGRAGGGHEAAVVVDAVDRKYLLKDLTNLIAQEDAHVLSIRSESGRHGQQRLHLQVRVQDFGQLSRLLGKIDSLQIGSETGREGGGQ